MRDERAAMRTQELGHLRLIQYMQQEELTKDQIFTQAGQGECDSETHMRTVVSSKTFEQIMGSPPKGAYKKNIAASFAFGRKVFTFDPSAHRRSHHQIGWVFFWSIHSIDGRSINQENRTKGCTVLLIKCLSGTHLLLTHDLHIAV